MQGGKDAAELVANEQSKMLYNALDKGVELGEFYIRGVVAGFDLQTPLDKQKALEAVQKYTFALEPLIAQSYTNLVAQLLGVSVDFVRLSPKAGFKKGFEKNLNLNAPSKQANTDLAELQALIFLYENPQFQALFLELCDERFFKDKESLQAILQGQGIENALVRELLEFQSIKKLKKFQSVDEFLLSLSKIMLGFFNRSKCADIVFSLKKQLLSLVDKNVFKLQKQLSNAEFQRLLSEILKDLKQNDDENALMQRLKNFQKNRFDLSAEIF